MSSIRNLDYPTSTDYDRLWELAQRQSVACIVDSTWPGSTDPPCRDICRTIYADGTLHVSARGIGYIDGYNPEEFAESCARVNLEWILPAGERGTPTASEVAAAIKRHGEDPPKFDREQEKADFLAVNERLRVLTDD